MSKVTRRDAMGLGVAAVAGAGVVAGGGLALQGCAATGQILEPAKTIDVLTQCDVLVLGGGPAGMSAAIAAAREGVEVVIVERYGSFGGVITQQTMGSISWYRFSQTVDAGGVRLEFEDKAKEMGATIDVLGEEGRGVVDDWLLDTYHDYLEEAGLRTDGVPNYEILETELFKWVADQMLVDAGVTPILHCWAVEVLKQGNKVTGVITESKSGRQAILAKRIIDCTGDADVANFAGAPWWMSEKPDLMETTVQFGMSNVRLQAVLLYLYMASGDVGDWSDTGADTSTMLSPRVVEPYLRAIEAGEIPIEEDVEYTSYFGAFTFCNEIPDMNTVHLHGIDGTDVWDLTDAEIRGRERAVWAMDALRKYCSGFADARIRTFAQALGVRDTRHIIGEYSLTESDVRNQARFDDSIGICPEFLDGFGNMLLPTTGRYFQVPYGVILPDKVENLLVAGRPVSSDRIAMTATRQMTCCCVTGQGAGIAAAQSIKDGVTCRNVDRATLQQRLEAQDVRLA